jgi:hypothetical protein
VGNDSDHISPRSDMSAAGQSSGPTIPCRDPVVGIQHSFDLVTRRRCSSSCSSTKYDRRDNGLIVAYPRTTPRRAELGCRRGSIRGVERAPRRFGKAIGNFLHLVLMLARFRSPTSYWMFATILLQQSGPRSW